MDNAVKVPVLFLSAVVMAFVFQLSGTEVLAQSSYFTSLGCVSCHVAPVVASCNGCHAHGTHPSNAKSSINVAGTTNKTTYTPGETVTVTMTGGYRTGWFRATLFDQDGVTELARSNGTASGMGNSATYPATLTAPAPATPGTYTWVIAWYGNKYDASSGAFGAKWTPDPNNTNAGTPNAAHGWEKVSLPSFTVAAATVPDTTPPTLTVSTLADGSLTNLVTLNVSGSASDAGGLQSVTVNGQAVTVNADGSFSAALNLVAGANVITVVAADQAGNQATDSRTITYDPAAPVLTVTAPADNSTTTQSFVTVTGTVNETSTVTVTDNSGSPQSAAIDGNNFTATINLVSGLNTIDITATDLAGNSTNAKRTVAYNPVTLSLAVTNPAQDITTNQADYTIQGTVTGAQTPVTITITVDGQTYTPPVSNGSFTQTITFAAPKTYAVTVTAADQAGNQNTVQRNIIYTIVAGGDIDGDNAITIADALMSLKLAVGMIPMNPAYLAQGDIAPYVNGQSQPDGKIDISDALLILKICVGAPL